MTHHVNYGTEKKYFSIPKGWELISAEDKPPTPPVSDPIQEIRRALDHPIGSPNDVTEGLSPEQVKMMNFIYSQTLQEAIQRPAESLPQAAVVIFPSGGIAFPK
jgi:hypothetical protein